MIAQMRNKIIFKKWATSKEPGGGVTKTLDSTFSVWANIEDRSGFIQTSNDQRQWPYDYKVQVRYDDRINEQLTITHENKELQINSIQIREEGKKKVFVMRCSTI